MSGQQFGGGDVLSLVGVKSLPFKLCCFAWAWTGLGQKPYGSVDNRCSTLNSNCYIRTWWQELNSAIEIHLLLCCRQKFSLAGFSEEDLRSPKNLKNLFEKLGSETQQKLCKPRGETEEVRSVQGQCEGSIHEGIKRRGATGRPQRVCRHEP
ncbi:hypothetical protein ACMD2_22957 [Ananas comosus]|uniref:Uncharacterized protein n=1 Tax=Ananas comosus TaxID=4615 RepID=A0A199V811_ANACO|nr:hypothetical protein ACMD2_22957 [Ananas comosus]